MSKQSGGTKLVTPDIIAPQFARDGFAVVPEVLEDTRCDLLASHLESYAAGGVGSRQLLEQTWCRALVDELRRQPVLRELLPVNSVAVQCTFFDKSPSKNWLVSLHQDLSIPVRARVAAAECSGWSEKEGVVFVQPPVEILEQSMAVRVHIDDCPAESGPLRVVPGSHAHGRLDAHGADALRAARGEVVVAVQRGGVLVMRPLILHASSKASVPRPRRVLHFVFGSAQLPFGLEWRWAMN